MAIEDRAEGLNRLLASLLRDGYGPPSSPSGLARMLARHDNPLLRLAQSGPPTKASSPDDARWMRERNIQLDRENTASGYFGHFSEPEMQEYLATGREPRDIMQRVEAAAAEREAARRPRSLPPPSSGLVPLSLPPPSPHEEGPPPNRLAELLSKPLDQIPFHGLPATRRWASAAPRLPNPALQRWTRDLSGWLRRNRD
jgi:hypothetical protein